jgi:hypothetical protein
LSYRGKQKGSYGNQKHHRGFWHLGGKNKDDQYEAEDYQDNEKEVIFVRDEEDKPKQLFQI